MDNFSKEIKDLLKVIQDLSLTTSLAEIVDIIRHAARKFSEADGATFVLRDGNFCYYVDEDAISPLWKGKKFPIETCVSGWSMLNKQSVAIEDVFKDPRIPIDAYEPTFVKSLLMVPIRLTKPIGAIGIYWAKKHMPTEDERLLLEALAQSTSIAIENVQHLARIEAASRTKDELLSIVGHELRTPLSAIKLQLQMVDKNLKEKKLIKESGLELSLSQIENMGLLVEQLMEASQILLHDLQLNPKKVDFGALLQRSAAFWKPRLSQSQSQITLNLENNLSCHIDELSIERVLNNLFSNVIKHSAGSNIIIKCQSDERFLNLSFEDDGPGIPQEIQSNLFRLFERGIAPRYVRGLGLGLYISRNLIEANGGQISIDDSDSPGTKYLIKLPV